MTLFAVGRYLDRVVHIAAAGGSPARSVVLDSCQIDTLLAIRSDHLPVASRRTGTRHPTASCEAVVPAFAGMRTKCNATWLRSAGARCDRPGRCSVWRRLLRDPSGSRCFARSQPGAGRPGAIVVASKIDTEGALLGQMTAFLARTKGLPVERKIQLGPTAIVRAAILAGQIDLYPDTPETAPSSSIARPTRRGRTPPPLCPGQTARRRGNRLAWLARRRPTHLGHRDRGDLAGLPARRCLDDLAPISPPAPLQLAARPNCRKPRRSRLRE